MGSVMNEALYVAIKQYLKPYSLLKNKSIANIFFFFNQKDADFLWSFGISIT